MGTTNRGFSERRRGERVLIRIPVKVHSADSAGPYINEEAEAVVVSRFGALLRVATPPQNGAMVEVLNSFSHEVERFRVVWVGGEAKEGRYDVGVELVTQRDNFWGIRFPAAERKS